MVRRFQQKEENYTTLLATVSSSEARVDDLKKENEHLTAMMQDLQIERKDDESTEDASKVDANDTEIIEMNQDLTLVQQDY